LTLNSQAFAPADWKHTPQPMSCSHALSIKEKESIWPTESSLGNKLHGTATDLRLTVQFIALTGLHI